LHFEPSRGAARMGAPGTPLASCHRHAGLSCAGHLRRRTRRMKRSIIAAVVAGLTAPVLSAQVYAQAMGAPAATTPPSAAAVPAQPPTTPAPPATVDTSVAPPVADTDAGKGEQPLPGGQFVNVSELKDVE